MFKRLNFLHRHIQTTACLMNLKVRYIKEMKGLQLKSKAYLELKRASKLLRKNS